MEKRGRLVFTVSLVIALAALSFFSNYQTPTGLAGSNLLPQFDGASFNTTTQLLIDLNNHFSDPELESLTFEVDDSAAIVEEGKLIFDPPQGFSGEYVVSVTVSDGTNSIIKPVSVFVEGGQDVESVPEPDVIQVVEPEQQEPEGTSEGIAGTSDVTVSATCSDCSGCTTCAGTAHNVCVLDADMSGTGCITSVSDSVVIDCNGHTINHGSGTGVNADNAFNVTIRSCNMTGSGESISFASTTNSSVWNVTSRSTSSNFVGMSSSASHNLVANSSFDLINGRGVEIIGNAAQNNTIENVTGFSTSQAIWTSGYNTTIRNVTVVGGFQGIQITNGALNTTVIDSKGFSNTSSGNGIELSSTNVGSTVINSFAYSDSSFGLELFGATDANIINTTAGSNDSYALRLLSSETNINFSNLTLASNDSWVLASSSISNVRVENLTLSSDNGSIRLKDSATMPASTEINASEVLINNNSAFLNGTEQAFLNQSAEIRLKNIGFTSAVAQVDYEDDGSFETCDSPQCSGVAQIGSELVFNVSGFTTYGVSDANSLPSIGLVNLTSTSGSNLTSDNLTATLFNVSDADGDAVKNISDWKLNGSSIALLNMPFEGHDGDESTTAKDYSDSANNGTVSSASWSQASGFDGFAAYNFSANGYINASFIQSYNVTENFSVEVRFLADSSFTGERFVVAKHNSWRLRYAGSGNNFEFFDEQSGIANASISKDVWHHVVGVQNGSHILLYVDGSLVASDPAGAMNMTDDSICIGAQSCNTNFFAGLIDEVRIWNRTLSAEQIAALYNNRTDLVVSDETSVSDVWSVEVTPNDGQPNTDGVTASSNNVTISGSIPSIGQAILNSTNGTGAQGNATRYENLTLHLNANDPDGDTLKNITDWMIGTRSLAVANLPFETGSSASSTPDISTFGNGATVTGATYGSTSGYDGFGAYSFDGTNDIMDISFDPSLNFTDFTITGWFFWESEHPSDPWRAIISKGAGNGNGGDDNFLIFVNDPTRTVGVRVGHGGSLSTSFSTPTTVDDSQWHHFALAYSSTEGTGRFYIDGSIGSNLTGLRPATTNSNGIAIGYWDVGSPFGEWDGLIDDILIYDRALSDDQIKLLAANNTDKIVNEETFPGEIWSANVTPYDGSLAGTTLTSNNVTIVNSDPTISQVILNSTSPDNTTNDNLTSYLINVSDAEGDSVKNITNWYVNGSPFPVLNLPFEGESSSTSTKDYTSFDHTGTVSGPTYNPSNGHDGFGSYYFDGGGGTITVPFHQSFNLTDFTLSGWFFWRSEHPDDDFRAVISKTGETGFGYDDDFLVFVGDAAHTISVRVGHGNPDATTFGSSTLVNDSAWHQFILSYSSSEGTGRFYVDGTLESNLTDIDPSTTNPNDIIIGQWKVPGPFGEWHGSIDDITLYDRALSDEQVQLLSSGNTLTIHSSETAPSETWFTNTTVYDGATDGLSTLSNNITIEAPPTIGAVVVNSTTGTNTSTENLTAFFINVTDADGDAVKNITNWFVDDVSLTVLNTPFEGNGGDESTSAKDYSSSLNNLSVTGAVYNSSGGFDGLGAYDFDGSGDFLSGTGYNIDVFSIAAWVKVEGTVSQFKGIAEFSADTTGKRRGIGLSTVGEPFIAYDSNDYRISSSGDIDDGLWHHVVGTYDGSTPRLYVDGSEVTLGGELGAISADSTLILRVGDFTATGFSFNGLIDEVSIWNRSLSADQVLALFENRTNVIVSDETSLGDTWYANVTPNDGTQDGVSVISNDLTIKSNEPPSIDAVILNSTAGTNSTSENLTAFIINATDLEGEAVKNITRWIVDSSGIEALIMPFEGGSNSTFTKDYSSNSNNGTVTTATFNSSGGRDGFGAYEFDGANDFITVLDDSSLEHQQISLSAFLKVTGDGSASDGVYALAKGRQGGEPFNSYGIIYIPTSDILSCGFGISGTFRDSNSTSTITPGSDWVHVGCSYDGSNLRIYINGSLENTTSVSGTIDYGLTTDDLRIGDWGVTASERRFEGFIDDVRIFNRNLSSEQFAQLAIKEQPTLITSSETSGSDVWQVCATPNDITSDGSEVCSNSLTISNIKPTIGLANLTSTFGTNLSSENLTATLFNVSDVDGDSVKNITDWKLNGTSITVLNMPFEGHDGDESTTAKDYSGFGNNGTVVDAVWNQTGGFDGFGAYTFDGSADYINLTDKAVFDFSSSSSAFSVVVWVNQSSAADECVFISKYHSTGNQRGYTIQTDALDAKPEIVLSEDGTSGANLVYQSDSAISLNEFIHLAFTVDVGNDEFHIYENGSEVSAAHQTATTTISDIFENDQPVLIGALNNGTGNDCFGTIDDLYVFNRSLSADQVLALYNNRTDLIVSNETFVDDVWSVDVTPNDGLPNTDGVTVSSNNVTILADLSATALSECTTISTSGDYILSNNVSADGTCMNITASNVNFNCNGNAIDWNGGTNDDTYGINVTSAVNVNISNCFVVNNGSGTSDDTVGIIFVDVNNSIVNLTNITSRGSLRNNLISLSSSNSNIVENSILETVGATSNSNDGITLGSGSNGNTFTNVSVTTSGTNVNNGVNIDSSSNNIFSNMTIVTLGTNNNRGFSVETTSASNNVLRGSMIVTGTTHSNYGVRTISEGTEIINNTIITGESGSDNYGVYIQNPNQNFVVQDNIVENNTIITNGSDSNYGVALQNSNGFNEIMGSNSIIGNNISTNGSSTSKGENYGIYINAANDPIVGTIIYNNTIRTEGNDNNEGMYIFRGTNTSISFNNVTTSSRASDDAANHGIHVFRDAHNATIFNNTINPNGIESFGILIGNSLDANLSNNSMDSEYEGLLIKGDTFEEFSSHSIEVNNVVNGRAIQYYGGAGLSPACPGAVTLTAPTAGHIDLIGCTNTIIEQFDAEDSITIVNGSNNAVSNSNMTGNKFGVRLSVGAYDNLVVNNTIDVNATQYAAGVTVNVSSENNTIENNTITTFGTAPSGETSNSDAYGISLSDNVYGTRIVNNSILTDGDRQNHCINSERNVNETYIANNTLESGGATISRCIVFDDSYNVFVVNNSIAAIPSGESDAVRITGDSDNHTYVKNVVTTVNAVGLDVNLDNSVQGRLVIADNFINSTGTGSNEGSLSFNGNVNNSLIENNTLFGRTAIRFTATGANVANNVTLSNNTINATFNGIIMNGLADSVIEDNEINVSNSNPGNAIEFDGSGSTGVIARRNTIYYQGTGVPIVTNAGAFDNVIDGNNLTHSQAGTNSIGIRIRSTSTANNVTNNTVLVLASGSNVPALFSNTDDVVFDGNNATIVNIISGTGNSALELEGSADRNIVRNNILRSFGDVGIGVRLNAPDVTGSDNVFVDNVIVTNESDSSGVLMGDAAVSMAFTNTLFNDTWRWINGEGEGTEHNFTNSTFRTADGNINIQGQFVFNGSSDLDKNQLNITFDRARVNSSAVPFVNTSARVTLNNIASFADPKPQVDFEDDGTFEDCDPPQCVEVSFNASGNNTYVFDVSSFTTYGTSANNSLPSIGQVILNSTDGSGETGNNATSDENLTAVIINVTDSDGDSVNNITDWKLNGTSIAVLNLPFESVDIGSYLANSSLDFSAVTQGLHNWSYFSSAIGSDTYVDLISAGTSWTSDGGVGEGIFISRDRVLPAANAVGDVVRAWTAPVTGTVIAFATISDVQPGSGDGIEYTIKRNTTQLLSQNFSDGFGVTTLSVTTAISAGETLYFRTNRRTSRTNDVTEERLIIYQAPAENTTLKDYSSFNYTGSVFGATRNLTGGVHGFGALEFDGDNDMVAYGDILDIELNQPNTIAFWLKHRPSVINTFVLAKEDNFNQGGGWHVIHRANGSIQFALVNQTTNRLLVRTVPLLTPDVFHHVAITLDNTSSAAGTKIYLNGTSVPLEIVADSLTSPTGVSERFQIGCRERCTFGLLNGTIDEVLIFNRSLSAEQVALIAANRTDSIASNETSVGDVWSVDVTPNDGRPNTDGATVSSNNVTIISEVGCGSILSENTTMTGDLNCASSGLTLGASDISLDCAGNTITFNTGGSANVFGIKTENVDNVVVKNCIVFEGSSAGGFSEALNVSGTTESLFFNNTLNTSSGSSDAIGIISSSSINVENSTLNGSDDAVDVQLSSNETLIVGNVMISEDDGVVSDGTSDRVIAAQNAIGADSTDCFSLRGDDNLVDQNNLTCGADGVFLTGSGDRTNITRNIINASDDGVDDGGSNDDTRVLFNTINASDDGADSDGVRAVFIENTVIAAGDDCIAVFANEASILRNNVSGCAADGIFISAASDSNVSGNSVTGTDDGIDISGSATGVLVSNNTVTAGASGEGVEICSSCDSAIILNNTVTSAGSDGVEVGGAENVVVSGNVLIASDDGVDLFSGALNTLITNNTLVAGGSGEGVEFSGSDDNVNITNNTISAGSDCVEMNGDDSILIADNHMVSCSSEGIDVGAGMTGLTVRNNTINSTSDGIGVFTTSAVDVLLSDNSISSLQECINNQGSDDMVITNNVLSTCGFNGVNLSSTATDILIDNNTIVASVSGVQIFGTSNARVNMTANTIQAGDDCIDNSGADNSIAARNVLISCGNDGITMNSGSPGMLVYNNTINSSQEGVDFDSTSENNGNASGNIITSGNDCVGIDGGDNIVIENNTGVSCGDDGMDVDSSVTGLLVQDNNFTASDDGIFFASVSQSAVLRNVIIAADDGVQLDDRTEQLTFQNNTIVAQSDGFVLDTAIDLNISSNFVNSSDDGVDFDTSSNDSTIFNNTFITGAQGFDITGGASDRVNISNNTVTSFADCILHEEGANLTVSFNQFLFCSSDGLDIEESINALVEFNYVNGTQNAIEFELTNASAAVGNDVRGLQGVALVNFSNDNLVENNSMNASGGLFVDNESARNRLVNNSINATVSDAIYVGNSSDNVFVNNTIISVAGYAARVNRSITTVFEGMSLPSSSPAMLINESNGSIEFTQSMTFASAVNLSEVVSIQPNTAFVNTSNPAGGQLNKSARITLTGVTFVDPQPLVDFEDDGTLDNCDPPQCVEVSFLGGRFAYDVLSFTTYSSNETVQNVTLIKLGGPDPVIRGDELNYTINVSNVGTSTSFNVTVEDVLPSGVTFVSSQPAPISGTTFDVGNISPGGEFLINITARSSLGLSNGTSLNNTALLNFTNSSGQVVQSNVSVVTSVIGRSNLGIVKADSPDPANLSENVTYSITVTNNGDFLASGIVVDETYPATLTFISSQPSPNSGNNIFAVPSLSENESFVINITVNFSSTGAKVNNVSVNFTNSSSEVESRQASETTTISAVSPPAPTPTLSSGGGGGGNRQTAVNVPVPPGIEYAMVLPEQVTPVMSRGDSLTFSVGSESHKLTVLAVELGTATVKIESEPKIVKVIEGVVTYVDVNDDGVNDIRIEIDEILSQRVSFKVTRLEQPSIEVPTSVPEPDPILDEKRPEPEAEKPVTGIAWKPSEPKAQKGPGAFSKFAKRARAMWADIGPALSSRVGKVLSTVIVLLLVILLLVKMNARLHLGEKVRWKAHRAKHEALSKVKPNAHRKHVTKLHKDIDKIDDELKNINKLLKEYDRRHKR